MKYIERPICIEMHPETLSDRQHLEKTYGAVGLYRFWCVSKTPKEVFGLLQVKDLIKEYENASNSTS